MLVRRTRRGSEISGHNNVSFRSANDGRTSSFITCEHIRYETKVKPMTVPSHSVSHGLSLRFLPAEMELRNEPVLHAEGNHAEQKCL
jgi:hypothetical protein